MWLLAESFRWTSAWIRQPGALHCLLAVTLTHFFRNQPTEYILLRPCTASREHVASDSESMYAVRTHGQTAARGGRRQAQFMRQAMRRDALIAGQEEFNLCVSPPMG